MDDITEVTGAESMQWNRTAQEPVCPAGQGQTSASLPPIDPGVLQDVQAAIAAEAAALA